MSKRSSKAVVKVELPEHSLYTSRPPTPVNSEDLRTLGQRANFHVRNDGLIINKLDSQLNLTPLTAKSSLATVIPIDPSKFALFDCTSRDVIKTPAQSATTILISAGLSKSRSKAPTQPPAEKLSIPQKPVSKYIKVERVVTDSKGNEQTITVGYKNMQRVGVGYQFGFKDIDVSSQSLYELPPGLLNPRGINVNVSGNYLQSLDGIRMPYLAQIDASNNELTEFGDFGSSPEALRIANFSKNFIKKALNLKTFWALTELNLSYNEIDEISDINQLQYLIKLDLSHNRIKTFPSTASSSLVSLNLNHNELKQVPDLKFCTQLNHLALAFNSISDLEPLRNCTRLLNLWLQENSISDLQQLTNLKPLLGLHSLTLYPNPIVAVGMYRQMIIFILPQILIFDGQKIQAKEKVDAKDIFAPDLTELVSRDRMENMLERASQSGTTIFDEFIYKRQLPPVILLVGAPLSRCTKLAAMLKVQFREKLHLGGVHSTATTLEIPIPNKDIPVSYETFEQMKSRGEFLARSHILGRACGFTSSQILRAAERSAILIASVPLAVALAVRDYDIRPKVILVTPAHVYENPFIAQRNIWDELENAFSGSGDSTPREPDAPTTSEDADRAVTFIVRKDLNGPANGEIPGECDDTQEAFPAATTQCDSNCSLQDGKSFPDLTKSCKSGKSPSPPLTAANEQLDVERTDLFPTSQPVNLTFSRIQTAQVKPSSTSSIKHKIIRHTRDTMCGVPSYELIFNSPLPQTSDVGIDNEIVVGNSHRPDPSAISYPLPHDTFNMVHPTCQVSPQNYTFPSLEPDNPNGSASQPSTLSTEEERANSDLHNCCPAVSNLNYPFLPLPVYSLQKEGEPSGIKCYYPVSNSQQGAAELYGMNSGVFFDGSFPQDFFDPHNHEPSSDDRYPGEFYGESGFESNQNDPNYIPRTNTLSYNGSLCEYPGEVTPYYANSCPGNRDYDVSASPGVVSAADGYSSVDPAEILRGSSRTAITAQSDISVSTFTDERSATSHPYMTFPKNYTEEAGGTKYSFRKSLSFASARASSISLPDSQSMDQESLTSSSLQSLNLPVFKSQGKVVLLQKHQQATANCIIKTREEYLQFHQDHPGVFHTVVANADIDECFEILCTLIEETLENNFESTTEPCAHTCHTVSGKDSLWKNQRDGRAFQKNILNNYINLARAYYTGTA